MQKLEQEILTWHLAQFPDATKRTEIKKLHEELCEVSEALLYGTNEEAVVEIADVCIVCIRLANMNHVAIADFFTQTWSHSMINATAQLLAESVRERELVGAIQDFYGSAYAWCETHGYGLFEEIKKKLEINKKRNWEER